jgi:hypothetical protein
MATIWYSHRVHGTETKSNGVSWPRAHNGVSWPLALSESDKDSRKSLSHPVSLFPILQKF